MTLKTNTKLCYKFGISNEQLKLAKSYIQGAVYCWKTIALDKNTEIPIFYKNESVEIAGF